MAVPTNIRQLNRRAILMTLLRSGTSTRSVLARETGLSQPTVGKIVEELVAERVVRNVDGVSGPSSRMGRPGHELTLDGVKSSFLAVQIGVRTTRLATMAVTPLPADRWLRTFATPKSAEAWSDAFQRAVGPLLTASLRAVLVSVPGVLNETTGLSLLSPNLRWLEGRNVIDLARPTLKLPVFVVQEIRCLALGHGMIDRSAEDFLLVDFGVGVGAAPVLRGRLLEGHLPLSGELGHTPVPGRNEPCGCGGYGCLETLVGRTPLLATLDTRRSGPLSADARSRLDAAALGIAGALNVLGLDRVVLTGLINELPVTATDLLRDRIRSAAVAGRFGDMHVLLAPRRRLAGLASVGLDRVLAPT